MDGSDLVMARSGRRGSVLLLEPDQSCAVQPFVLKAFKSKARVSRRRVRKQFKIIERGKVNNKKRQSGMLTM